jgi:tellurite resistance protein
MRREKRIVRLPTIPPNFFGISFGLAGLAEVWTLASPTLGITDIVSRVLLLAAAAVWCALLVIYFSKGWRGVQEDWRNPILSPFLASSSLLQRCWRANSAR